MSSYGKVDAVGEYITIVCKYYIPYEGREACLVDYTPGKGS